MKDRKNESMVCPTKRDSDVACILVLSASEHRGGGGKGGGMHFFLNRTRMIRKGRSSRSM